LKHTINAECIKVHTFEFQFTENVADSQIMTALLKIYTPLPYT